MENNLIVVDKNEIAQFVEEGGKLVLKQNAEEHLIKLLQLEELIKNAIEEVKKKVIEAGTSIDPDFKGVVGRQIKAFYRYTDSPYEFDKNHAEVAQPFLKETKYFRVDSPKVDEYLEEKGELPIGIYPKENREKKLVISFKEMEEI